MRPDLLRAIRCNLLASKLIRSDEGRNFFRFRRGSKNRQRYERCAKQRDDW